MTETTTKKDYGFFIICLVVLILIVAAWVYTRNELKDLEPTVRGTFGDMFGSVNALFSGLAFAGIIVTILLQRKELALQRQDNERPPHRKIHKMH